VSTSFTNSVFLSCTNHSLIHHSFRSALPRRDRPYHLHLHCRQRLATAEPVVQRTHGTTTRPPAHNTSLCFCRSHHDRRMVTSLPSTSQLRALDHLQRQSCACHLCSRTRHLRHCCRPARRHHPHTQQRRPCMARHLHDRFLHRNLYTNCSMEGHVRCPPRYAPPTRSTMGAFRIRRRATDLRVQIRLVRQCRLAFLEQLVGRRAMGCPVREAQCCSQNLRSRSLDPRACSAPDTRYHLHPSHLGCSDYLWCGCRHLLCHPPGQLLLVSGWPHHAKFAIYPT